jgi:CheY-like chemotaxis protein
VFRVDRTAVSSGATQIHADLGHQVGDFEGTFRPLCNHAFVLARDRKCRRTMGCDGVGTSIRTSQPPAVHTEMTTESLSEVAVVDDDHAVLESVADLLNSAGYVARTFSSAREFIDHGALDSVGCLVSDIRMPGMDGWELRSFLQKRRPGLPVILISAHEDPENDVNSPHSVASVWRMFRKPFEGHELLAAVKSALETHAE